MANTNVYDTDFDINKSLEEFKKRSETSYLEQHPRHPMAEIFEAEVRQQDMGYAESIQNQLQQSNVYKNFFNSQEDDLKEARQIALTTKIPENAILESKDTLAKAREVYNTYQYLSDLGGSPADDSTLIKLYEQYPGLKELADKSPAEAAIALKNIQNIKRTQGTLDAASAYWRRGNLEHEQDLLYFKKGAGIGFSPEDENRIKEIEKQLAELPEMAPSVFDRNILETIAGETAHQLPQMLDALGEGLTAFAVVEGGGIATGGLLGLPAGPPGVVGGMGAGAVTAFPFAAKAFAGGMFTNIATASTGRNYKEYLQVQDKQGNRVYTDREAFWYGATQGTIEAGIETFSFGQVAKTFGKVLLSNTAKATLTNTIVKSAAAEEARLTTRAFTAEVLKAQLKSAGYEISEEATQEAASMITDNIFINIKKREGFDLDYHSAYEIVNNSFDAGIQAIPASMGLSFMGGLVTSPVTVYRGYSIAKKNNAQQIGLMNNVEGQAQFDALKAVKSDLVELKDKSPEVQKEILQAKFEETGHGTWYVDTESLLKEEQGQEILQKLAEAQGISNQELAIAVQNNADIQVDSAVYAQSILTTDLDDIARNHITTAEDIPTIARLEEAKQKAEKLQAIMQQDMQKEAQVFDKYIKVHFPQEGLEQDMAATAIYRNPANPSQGWESLNKELDAEIDEKLRPYYEYMEQTGKQGVTIVRDADINAVNDVSGKGIRVSDNDQWYSNFYKEYNRPPNKQEARQIAYDMAVGNIANPINYGVAPEVLEQEKQVLDNLFNEQTSVQSVKDKLKNLNASEMALTKELSQEGVQVYYTVLSRLEKIAQNINAPKAKRAARLGAILFARHADVYASAMREAGNAEYTALDYLRKVDFLEAIDLSGKDIYEQKDNVAPVVEIDINKLPYSLNGDVASVRKWMLNNLSGKEVLIRNDGTLQKFTNTGLRASLKRGRNDTHNIMYFELEKLLENAVLDKFEVADAKHSWLKGQKVYYVVAKIGEEYYSVRFKIDLFNNKQPAAYKDHKAKKIEPSPYGSSSSNAEIATRNQGSISNISIAVLKGDVKPTSLSNGVLRQGVNGLAKILNNGRRLVSLFESANESTIPHEFAHVFLADLKELAEIKNVPQWVKDDWLTIKKEFKWKKGQKDFTNAQQEQFARGFEAYLMSGNAPTKALKAVFRRFKSWLSKIYEDAKRLGGRVSPEIESVMSRMIASQEEIDVELQLQEVDAFEKANGIEGLSQSAANMYDRWQQEIAEESKEKLLAFIMNDLQALDATKKKQLLEQERKEYRKELEQSKIWQANEIYLRSGKNSNILNNLGYSSLEQFQVELEKAGGNIENALNKHMEEFERVLVSPPIDQDSLSERANELINSNVYKDRLVAYEYEALRSKIYGAENTEAVITQRLLAVEEAVENAPEEVSGKEQRLQDAVNNLKYAARWREAEFKLILQIQEAKSKQRLEDAIKAFKAQVKQSQKERSNNIKVYRESIVNMAKIAGQAADLQMQEMQIPQATNPNMWLRKEAAQNKIVVEAMAKGKLKEALEAKQLQLAYASMAKLAIKNKQVVSRKLQQLRTRDRIISSAKNKASIAEKYYYNNLMYRLGLKKKDAATPLSETPTLPDLFTGYTQGLEMRGGLSQWFLERLNNGDNLNYKQLTVNEFEEVHEIMSVLYKVSKDNDSFKTRRGEKISEAIQEIINSIYTNSGRTINRNLINEDTNELGGFAGRYVSQILKPEVLLELLDGGKGGIAHDYLYNTLFKGQIENLRLSGKAKSKLDEIRKPYSEKELYEITTDKKYTLPSTGEVFTKENLIMMALNWGTEINQSRLMTGFNLSRAEVNELLSNLTAKDIKFVQDIWDFINSYWEDTVKVEERMNGTTLHKSEAVPFVIADTEGNTHQMRGGYFPIAYNAAKSKRATDLQNEDLAKQMMTTNVTLGTKLSFTKGRVKGEVLNRPLLLDFNVINNHVSDVINNITMREAVRDVFRIVNNEEFAIAVTNTLGSRSYRILQQWAKDAWNMEQVGDETLAKKLRVNANMAIMGYGTTTSLLNVANIAPMMHVLGKGRALSAIAEFYANSQECYQIVMEKSPLMAERARTIDPNLTEWNERMRPSKYSAISMIKRNAYTMIAWTDLMLSLPTWHAIYKDTFNNKIAEAQQNNTEINIDAIEEQAVLQADKAVREIFGSSMVHDLSPIQKGGELAKSLTPFYSFFNVQANVVMESYFMARTTGNYLEFCRAVLYRFIIMAAIETAVREAVRAFTDDDDEKKDVAYFAKEFTKNLIGNSAGGFFGIRDVVNMMLNWGFEGTNYGKGAPTSLYSLSLDRVNAFCQTAKSVFSDTGKKDFIDLGRDATRVLTSAYGFPDVVAGSFWQTMRWFDTDFEDDLWEYLSKVVFDKPTTKKK